MYTSTDTAWVREAFSSLPGVVEIGSVLAVPAAAPAWGGREGIRYAMLGRSDKGPDVFLRSHGTDFNILPRPWLGMGMRGCYSIGPGLVGPSRETTVVLAQLFGEEGGVLDRLCTDGRWAGAPLTAARPTYGRRCHYFSGWLA